MYNYISFLEGATEQETSAVTGIPVVLMDFLMRVIRFSGHFTHSDRPNTSNFQEGRGCHVKLGRSVWTSYAWYGGFAYQRKLSCDASSPGKGKAVIVPNCIGIPHL